MLIAIWKGDNLSILEHNNLTKDEIIFLKSIIVPLPEEDVYKELFAPATYLLYETFNNVKDKREFAIEVMRLFGEEKERVVIFYDNILSHVPTDAI